MAGQALAIFDLCAPEWHALHMLGLGVVGSKVGHLSVSWCFDFGLLLGLVPSIFQSPNHFWISFTQRPSFVYTMKMPKCLTGMWKPKCICRTLG